MNNHTAPSSKVRNEQFNKHHTTRYFHKHHKINKK